MQQPCQPKYAGLIGEERFKVLSDIQVVPIILAGKHTSWDIYGTMFLGGVMAQGYFWLEVDIWHRSTLY